MANSGNVKAKLLALLHILQTETDREHGLTMPQLIERLEARGLPAERKAVYRDIKALRAAGFDIERLRTRPPQYAFARSDLAFDDVMMLIDLVQASPFLSERRAKQLVKSLKSLVSDRERRTLSRRVHVAGRIRSQTESVFHSVDRIHEAMRLRRKIEFLYYGYDARLQRVARHDGRLYVATPVRVVFADRNYYFVGYDEQGEFRTYRIDRMRVAQISEEPAARDEAIAAYGAGEFEYLAFGMYAGEHVSATLHVEGALMDAVVDRFGRGGVVLVEAGADAADVVVKVQKSPQFFGWIAGLNGHVTIAGPEALVEEYRNWLASL